MIALRTMAPVLIDLATVAGSAERVPQEYLQFWNRLDAGLDALHTHAGLETFTLEHAREGSATSQYSTIASDSLGRSPHLITLRLDLENHPWPESPEHVDRVEEAVLRIYPHRVALLEISMILHEPPSLGLAMDGWLDALERSAIAYTERFAAELCSEIIAPLLAAMGTIDQKRRFFHLGEGASLTEHQVLWVSRSLLVSEPHRDLLAHWTKDTVDVQNAPLREELLTGKRNSLVRWLNYGFVDAASEGPEAFRTGSHSAQYDGLRHAQHTYASLDSVDSRLQMVLADAAAADRKWQLEQLRGDLIWLSQRAELIIMDRQQLLKYMTRTVREHFEDVLAAWEYVRLIEDPVRFKIELCNRRLDELASKRAAKSGLVTDLILLGIGITSIAGTALAITEFGRTTASDPNSTGYDLGSSRFTSWFASQPIDVVLIASAAASSILVVLYLYFRRDNGNS